MGDYERAQNTETPASKGAFVTAIEIRHSDPTLPPNSGGRSVKPGSTEGLGWWVWARPPKRPPELGCS